MLDIGANRIGDEGAIFAGALERRWRTPPSAAAASVGGRVGAGDGVGPRAAEAARCVVQVSRATTRE